MTKALDKEEPHWAFLKSTRFWALVIGAVVYYLHSKSWVGQMEMVLIETIMAGFAGFRTVDRLGEKIGNVKPVDK